MEKVKEIKTELGGTERKLAEGLGHSREIGRLLGLVELVGGFGCWLICQFPFRILTRKEAS